MYVGNSNAPFINSGTLEAKNGGLLALAGSWSNAGVITVNNGTLYLGGTFATADIGTINRTGGSVLVNGLLDASGGPLNLNAATGCTSCARSKTGTINTAGGAAIVPDAGTLDHVTVNGNIELGVAGWPT